MKNLNLNEASAYSAKSPYEIYQEWEGIPVEKGQAFRAGIVLGGFVLGLWPWLRRRWGRRR